MNATSNFKLNKQTKRFMSTFVSAEQRNQFNRNDCFDLLNHCVLVDCCVAASI